MILILELNDEVKFSFLDDGHWTCSYFCSVESWC